MVRKSVFPLLITVIALFLAAWTVRTSPSSSIVQSTEPAATGTAWATPTMADPSNGALQATTVPTGTEMTTPTAADPPSGSLQDTPTGTEMTTPTAADPSSSSLQTTPSGTETTTPTP